MGDRLQWEIDGRDWPNRSASRFVKAAGLQWHVQQFGPAPGEAPVIALLHGTGSSSHSWRDVAPRLAEHYSVVVMDLPGHAFTTMPPNAEQSLAGMSRNVAALLHELKISPTVIAGHSAGAAVAARMILDQSISPAALVSLNGAFIAFGGLAGQFFSPVAKLLAAGSVASRFFAWQANDPAIVQKLVRTTGSLLDDVGMDLYARLVRSPGHVSAALAMMAHWDLEPLERELPRLSLPVWMVAAENDTTVPAIQAAQIARRLPRSHQVLWPMLGHLAHEESPAQCVALLKSVMDEVLQN
ncbi:MAG: alpha/beta fold hydrolase [Betaproteobacteria bacterium]|nr:alpha/beta fold hydrolase [Betaproteobacteria bacterium]